MAARPPQRRRAVRRLGALAVAGAVVALGAACGTDATTTDAARDTTGITVPRTSGTRADPDAPVEGGALPPQDLAELASIYDPLLAPIGVHLTRGALVDLDAGGYVPSPDGTHLALYVAPNEPFTDDQYAEQLAPLASVLTPDVFDRWPGLVSYDVCQEGPDLDGDPETLPTTKSQFNVLRSGRNAVDWADLDLVGLLAAIPTNRSITLSASIDVRRSAAFTAAQQAADAASGGAPSSTPEPGPSKLPAP